MEHEWRVGPRDELVLAQAAELKVERGGVTFPKRQCHNGVFITVSVEGIRNKELSGEYRCTLEAGHDGDHEDGVIGWANY